MGGLLNWVKRVPNCKASAPGAISMSGNPLAHPALVAAFLRLRVDESHHPRLPGLNFA